MLSLSEISEVSAEICQRHVFDPAAVGNRLPQGYRLIPAEEYAKNDPIVADLLRRNPKYARFAIGSLCFLSVGAFTVDGVRVHPPGATPMAFWWARAEGPRDSRMQGKALWLQIASWYSRSLTERSKIVATDPTAQFTDIEVTQAEPDVWRVHLALADEVIDGKIRCSGEPTKRRESGPGYMSVPFTGEGAGYFWTMTYFGHHHQEARGEWQIQGTGVLSAAFKIQSEAGKFDTEFQNRWSALSGLYKFEPK
ncbi:MAG TPA: hypothetical protein DCE44_12340 [Verrucomicrobiales bacterium]|nr:hypothetical protein [Verrucomicrobiales bacterium]